MWFGHLRLQGLRNGDNSLYVMPPYFEITLLNILITMISLSFVVMKPSPIFLLRIVISTVDARQDEIRVKLKIHYPFAMLLVINHIQLSFQHVIQYRAGLTDCPHDFFHLSPITIDKLIH